MGALEAPQYRHTQERRTGTSRAEQTDRDHGGAGSSGGHGGAGSSGDHGGAGSSGGHGGAGSSGGHGRWSSELLLPPPPQFPWGSEGVSGVLRGQTDRTGQPTGTGSPPGLARRLRLLLGMTRSQRPSQGPSVTASTSTTREQAARMASMATARGAACPRRVSVDKTRHDD